MDARTLIALVGGMSDEEHAALKLALRARTTPAQAAAAEAFTGKGWPCTATKPGCGRTFRTKARAAVHGVDKGGHTPLAK